MALFVIISFVLGLIIGSFANVFVLRWGTGRSLSSRSGCPACGHRLAWRELVPVVSFFVQRGRCRACETRISPHYVLVELLFGAL
ncbi:MAG TPA: prepilin peptidase, partial [Candidatus Paceibacterota bacterium]|nr:prepilin peptidase [Candidatus Paceibacterota bacterium]